MLTLPYFRDFIADDSGAVTVDWVVLTGAVMGLGLASYAVVSGGVADLAGDVSLQLSSQKIYVGAGKVQALDTFENGRDGWTTVGTNFDDPEIQGGSGIFLLDQGMFLERGFELDPDMGYAIVEMEFQTIGLFETQERLGMTINGELVDQSTFVNNKPRTVGGTGGAEISYTYKGTTKSTAEVQAARLAQYADDAGDTLSNNLDRVNTYTMRMVVTDPGASLDFGVTGTGTILQNIPGEGVSVNSVRVISTNAP